ncbi:MAG: hypothetical protein HYS22_06915 [Deltaproteobacteria bacterium]|nr:hypothetical protein [Deltaproteobacteria bacterium]
MGTFNSPWPVCHTDSLRQISVCEAPELASPELVSPELCEPSLTGLPDPAPVQDRYLAPVGDDFQETGPVGLASPEPAPAQPFLMLARLAIGSGDLPQASVYYGQAAELFGLEGDPEKALFYFDKAVRVLEGVPGQELHYHYARAEAAFFRALSEERKGNIVPARDEEAKAFEDYLHVADLVRSQEEILPESRRAISHELEAKLRFLVNRPLAEGRFETAVLYLRMWQEINPTPERAGQLLQVSFLSGRLNYRQELASVQREQGEVDRKIARDSRELQSLSPVIFTADLVPGTQVAQEIRRWQLETELKRLYGQRRELLDRFNRLEKKGKELRHEVRELVALAWGESPVEGSEGDLARELMLARTYEVMEENAEANAILRRVRESLWSRDSEEARGQAILLTHEIVLNKGDSPKGASPKGEEQEAGRELEAAFQMIQGLEDPVQKKILLAQNRVVAAALDMRRHQPDSAEAKITALLHFYEGNKKGEESLALKKEMAMGLLTLTELAGQEMVIALRDHDDKQAWQKASQKARRFLDTLEGWFTQGEFADLAEIVAQAHLVFGESLFESGKPEEGLVHIRDQVQKRYGETRTALTTRAPSFWAWRVSDAEGQPLLIGPNGQIKEDFNAGSVRELAKNIVVHSGQNSRWLTMGLVTAGSGLVLWGSGGTAAPVYVILGGIGGLAVDKGISVGRHWDQTSQGWRAGLSPASMDRVYHEFVVTGVEVGSLFLGGTAGMVVEQNMIWLGSQAVRAAAKTLPVGAARYFVGLTRLVPQTSWVGTALGANGQMTWGELALREMLARPLNATTVHGVVSGIQGRFAQGGDDASFWQGAFETWIFIRFFGMGQDLKLSRRILPRWEEPATGGRIRTAVNRQAVKAEQWTVDAMVGTGLHTGVRASLDLVGGPDLEGGIADSLWSGTFGFIPIHLGNKAGGLLLGSLAPHPTRGWLKDLAGESYRNWRGAEKTIREKAGFNTPEQLLREFVAGEVALTRNVTDQLERLPEEKNLEDIFRLFERLNGDVVLGWRERFLLAQAIVHGAAVRMIRTERARVTDWVDQVWEERNKGGVLDRELGLEGLSPAEREARQARRKEFMARRLGQTLERLERLLVELVGDFLHRETLRPMSDAEVREKIRAILYEGTIHPTQISRMELYRIERDFVVLLRQYGRLLRYLMEGDRDGAGRIRHEAATVAGSLRGMVVSLVGRVAQESSLELTPRGLRLGSTFVEEDSSARELTDYLAQVQRGETPLERGRVEGLVRATTGNFVERDSPFSTEALEILERASYELVLIRNHSAVAGRLPHQVAFWIDFDAAARPTSLALHTYATLLIQDIRRKASLVEGLPVGQRISLEGLEGSIEAVREVEVQVGLAEALRRSVSPEAGSEMARLLDEILPEEILRSRFLSRLSELRGAGEIIGRHLRETDVDPSRYSDLAPLVSYIPRFDHQSAEIPYTGPEAMTPPQRDRLEQMQRVLATARILVTSGGKALVPKVILCNTQGAEDLRRIVDFVDGEPPLDHLTVVPLFEDRPSVERIPETLEQLWGELGPARFRQRVNEVFIAGSDLSRVTSWPVALRLFLEAAGAVARFNEIHGTDIILKMGSGEALQRQNGMPDPFGGEPVWVEAEDGDPRQATSLRSPYWGVHSLLNIFPPNVRLITMQTRGHEVMIQVMTPNQARTFELQLQDYLGDPGEGERVNEFGAVTPEEFKNFSHLLEEGRYFETVQPETVPLNLLISRVLDEKIRPRGLARTRQGWVELVQMAATDPGQIPIRAITANAASETYYPMALVGLGFAFRDYLSHYGLESFRRLLTMLPAKEIVQAVRRFYLPNLAVFGDLPIYRDLRENMAILQGPEVFDPLKAEVERREGIHVEDDQETWTVEAGPVVTGGEASWTPRMSHPRVDHPWVDHPSVWSEVYDLMAPGYELFNRDPARPESAGPFPLANLRPDLRQTLAEADPLYLKTMAELTPFLKKIAAFWKEAKREVDALGENPEPAAVGAANHRLEALAKQLLESSPLGVSAAQLARALRGFNG